METRALLLARWRSGESTRLPPVWPRFKFRHRRHMWVEFVVGSLPCSERFFSGYSCFPLSSKTNISKFQLDQESGKRRTTMWMCYLQIIISFFLYLFIQLQKSENHLYFISKVTQEDFGNYTCTATDGKSFIVSAIIVRRIKAGLNVSVIPIVDKVDTN